MSFIIFIVILAILVLVHELGHFLIAKKSGIKVSEFGIGFPPRIWSKQKGETLYSVNAIPFGGYVKIFGEDPNEESNSGPEKGRSIGSKPRLVQAAVLFGGVFFNFLFAWLLITTGYIVGLPTPVAHSGPGQVINPHLVITTVSPGSPAYKSGIKVGDTIVEASSGKYVMKEISGQAVSNFIEAHGKDGFVMQIARGKTLFSTPQITGEEGIVQGKIAIGISMEEIGTLKLPIHQAIWEGGKTTVDTTYATAVGLLGFIKNALIGKGDFSQISGPVGIVGLVGDVSKLGLVYLLSFTAIISINLAVINLLPFPALDGGRLLFLLVEAIIRRPIAPKIANTLNQIGFVLLILLMVVVTFHDIVKLF
jgi:regulator of sigma E protease